MSNITGTNITEAGLNSMMGSMNMTEADLQFGIRNMTCTNMTEAKFQSKPQDSRALLRLGRESDTNSTSLMGGLIRKFCMTGNILSLYSTLVGYN